MKRLIFQCLPFVFFVFPAHASSSENISLRKELCGYISASQCCEEQNNFDASPPIGSVVNSFKYEYCENSSCRDISKNEIVSAGKLPRGASIRIHQKLTIIPKNGKELSWEVEEGYGFEGEMFSSPYEVEFEAKKQYFWLQRSYYENRSNAWISYATGDQFSFEGEPVVSPDGNHLFVHVVPVDDYSGPPVIKIYRVTKEEIKEQYRVGRKTNKKVTDSMIAGVTPIWVNSDQIALISNTGNSGGNIGAVIARIIRKEDKWVVTFERN